MSVIRASLGKRLALLYNKAMQEIRKLLEEDQLNISLFKKGNITVEVFKSKAQEINSRFFQLYKEHGFPSRKQVDEDIYKAAVVLTLHQPLQNLEDIFNDIKKLSTDEVNPKDLAYMTDKILVCKGKKQIYGTQYKINNGKIEFIAMEHTNNVEQRRKEVGLEPLEEYKKKAESQL